MRFGSLASENSTFVDCVDKVCMPQFVLVLLFARQLFVNVTDYFSLPPPPVFFVCLFVCLFDNLV